MKRAELKKILAPYYSQDSIKSLLCGRMKPSSKSMFMLNKKHKIPFTAWIDIKSFVTESVTNTETK